MGKFDVYIPDWSDDEYSGQGSDCLPWYDPEDQPNRRDYTPIGYREEDYDRGFEGWE